MSDTTLDMAEVEGELHRFPQASDLPLVLYRGVLASGGERAAKIYETLFARNGWAGSWRNGIYHYHHFHANAHEVLGIAAGQAFVRFGGEEGLVVEVHAGDVVVIPAGVSHCNEGASHDLLVVGAYPGGRSPDLNEGTPAEDPKSRAKLAKVERPDADPLYGRDGPLMRHWIAKAG
jgi:uncharacterized protein YjlB